MLWGYMGNLELIHMTCIVPVSGDGWAIKLMDLLRIMKWGRNRIEESVRMAAPAMITMILKNWYL
jgi:hypothetical protein